jgi:hypothetical protein
MMLPDEPIAITPKIAGNRFLRRILSNLMAGMTVAFTYSVQRIPEATALKAS